MITAIASLLHDSSSGGTDRSILRENSSGNVEDLGDLIPPSAVTRDRDQASTFSLSDEVVSKIMSASPIQNTIPGNALTVAGTDTTNERRVQRPETKRRKVSEREPSLPKDDIDDIFGNL